MPTDRELHLNVAVKVILITNVRQLRKRRWDAQLDHVVREVDVAHRGRNLRGTCLSRRRDRNAVSVGHIDVGASPVTLRVELACGHVDVVEVMRRHTTDHRDDTEVNRLDLSPVHADGMPCGILEGELSGEIARSDRAGRTDEDLAIVIERRDTALKSCVVHVSHAVHSQIVRRKFSSGDDEWCGEQGEECEFDFHRMWECLECEM